MLLHVMIELDFTSIELAVKLSLEFGAVNGAVDHDWLRIGIASRPCSR